VGLDSVFAINPGLLSTDLMNQLPYLNLNFPWIHRSLFIHILHLIFATIVGIPTYDHPDIYTLSFSHGSIAEYKDESGILETVPDTTKVPACSLLPHWVKRGANATLFLTTMPKPCHGKLLCDKNHNWFFCPGITSDVSQRIPLGDLVANCQSLLDSAQLFRGHAKFKRVYQACSQSNLHYASLDMFRLMG
jgi:hypothetical protein